MFEDASDEMTLSLIGEGVARARLGREWTQAELAKRAGVGKRTLERLEAGESTQVVSLIRVLRELALLDHLLASLPDDQPRPLDLLRLQGKQRQRAPRKPGKPGKGGKPSKVSEPGGEWQWGG